MVFFAKIMQTSEKSSSLLECFSECSLSYLKKCKRVKKTNESEELRTKSEETKFGGRRESQSNGSEYRESRAENVMK